MSLMPRAAKLLLILCTLSGPAAAQSTLAFLTPTTRLGASLSGPQFRVERRLNGAPTSTGTLTVTLSSSASTGEFNSNPGQDIGWTPTWTLNFADGDTAKTFVYRDSRPGTPNLTAAATGYPNATLAVVVDPEIISEDFDRPQLFWTDVPPGPWQFSDVAPSTANSVGSTPSGAHRGDGGLHTVDTASSGTFDDEADLGMSLEPIQPQVYFRGWFRMTQPDAVGVETVLAVHLNIGGGSPGLSLEIDSMGRFCLGGHDVNGTYSVAPCTVPVVPGSWYLLEGALTGLGSDAGVRTMWINGAQAATTTVDWSAKTAHSFTVGNAWGEPRDFTGTMDWDDFRATLYPPASTFNVQVPPVVAPGSCVAAKLSLVDSTGATAPAPYDVDATLVASNATVSLQPDCSAPTSLATLPNGSTGVTLYVSALALGPSTIVASHPDFIDGLASFDGGLLVADGGSSDGGTFSDGGAEPVDGGQDDSGLLDDGGTVRAGPRAARVGCGCDQSSGVMLLSMALLACLARRGRRACD
ncbi:MAG: LamG-like jellyroll fold domain-containing protein [Myxococcaceae bacterium]